MKAKELGNKILSFGEEHADSILTGLTCFFVIATGVSAYRTGPKVKKIMEEHKDGINSIDVIKDQIKEERYKEMKKDVCAETVKELVPAILPPIIFGSLACASAIGSNKVSNKRLAALSAAYEITRSALYDYKDKIIEIVPKKADEIREAVIKKKVEEDPVPEESQIYLTGKGDVLCKDTYTKVYFRSSMDEIKQAINRMSSRVMAESWVSLNDLYYELGVKPDRIPPVASDIGWHDSDLIDGNLPIIAKAVLDDTGTIPVIGLDYEVDPYFREGGRFR